MSATVALYTFGKLSTLLAMENSKPLDDKNGNPRTTRCMLNNNNTENIIFAATLGYTVKYDIMPSLCQYEDISY